MLNNLSRAEENSFNEDLSRMQRQEMEAAMKEESVNSYVDYMLSEALNNEQIFETLDHDYDIVQAYKPQIMRALRNLDDAIKGKEYARDAVFTALSQMQKNIKRVLRDID